MLGFVKDKINLIIAGGVALAMLLAWGHGYTRGLASLAKTQQAHTQQVVKSIVQGTQEDEALRQTIRSLPTDERKRRLSKWMRQD